ncbi:MAG: hypothetical protein EBU34_09070 [Alphaproteobacteria bacterium]|nr:hypothetical protein [Alphaproteobacteria bacterium]
MSNEKRAASIGDRLLKELIEYAREDVAETPTEIGVNHFAFVLDPKLKNRMAETLYGAKWVYSVGKLLATEQQELQAHVRTQVINYGAICEAVLEYTIIEAAKMKLLAGKHWKFSSINMKAKAKWGNPPANLPKGTNFAWMVAVAVEEKFIDTELEKQVTKLRELRNTIHLTNKEWSDETNQPKQSKDSHNTLGAVLKSVEVWLKSARVPQQTGTSACKVTVLLSPESGNNQ